MAPIRYTPRFPMTISPEDADGVINSQLFRELSRAACLSILQDGSYAGGGVAPSSKGKTDQRRS